jgi:DAACS family dicarboxylate/amino acid:cation (Na+ or H+) symporter
MTPDESELTSTVADDPESRPGGIPLYVWVVAAAILAVPVGLAWGEGASKLDILPTLIIRLIKAIATPLVVLAILSAIVTNEIHGRQGARMMLYYLINTFVAITIGLVLSNTLKPGLGADLSGGATGTAATAKLESKGIDQLLFEMVPESIGDAFAKNHLAQLVFVTLAIGIGLAKIRDEQRARGETDYLIVVKLVTVGFELLMRVLLWVVALVPIAVFGVVASKVGQKGFVQIFQSLLWFIVVVLAGLACQIAWYLTQMAVFARMSPLRFLAGVKDVMATSFSTASTGATMPITLRSLTGPLGVSRPSAQLAACVGTNFNNDGTALYQAAVVLFMAQAMGSNLTLADQIVVRGVHPLGRIRHPPPDLRRGGPVGREDPDHPHDRLVPRPLSDVVERPRRHDGRRPPRPDGRQARAGGGRRRGPGVGPRAATVAPIFSRVRSPRRPGPDGRGFSPAIAARWCRSRWPSHTPPVAGGGSPASSRGSGCSA